MRTFIFIFTLLVIGCSSSTAPEIEEDVFEPYTVGTWEITSPTNANWIGESGSAKTVQADTIDIKSPGQRDLKLIKPANAPTETYFIIQFTDSTINSQYWTDRNMKSIVIDVPKSNLPADQNPNHPYVFTINGSDGENTENYVKANFHADMQCGYLADFEDSNPIFLIRYETEAGQLVRAYRVFVNGILDAVHEIAC